MNPATGIASLAEELLKKRDLVPVLVLVLEHRSRSVGCYQKQIPESQQNILINSSKVA